MKFVSIFLSIFVTATMAQAAAVCEKQANDFIANETEGSGYNVDIYPTSAEEAIQQLEEYNEDMTAQDLKRVKAQAESGYFVYFVVSYHSGQGSGSELLIYQKNKCVLSNRYGLYAE